MTAREIAFAVLEKAERGGHASELVAEMSAGIAAREAGLAMTIAMGVLRWRARLDHAIAACATKPIEKLDSEVRTALRMGTFQLLYMDRVPAHAAVGESVNLVRRARKVSAAGFVNAVLRKVSGAVTKPMDRATELSIPDWLLAKWDRDFGVEVAAGIARAALEVPKTYIRAPEEQPAGSRATDIDGCFEVDSAPQGYRVQDIGSQAIVPLLDMRAGVSFLDVCAAPGNKTAQALESKPGFAVACDLSVKRLGLVDPTGAWRVALDATEPLPFTRKFDRILVDAPCSGTGTLGHNPEIKWRLTADSISSFATRQKRILTNALDLLAPGGTLVYSTCSLEKEENEAIARAVAGQRIVLEIRRTPGIEAGDGFYAAVIR